SKSFEGPRSRLLHFPPFITVGCWLICLAGLFAWPDKLRTLLPDGQHGLSLTRIQSNFQTEYMHELGWLSCVLIIWFLTFRRLVPASRLTPIVGLLMILEPFLHCWNLHPQPDPKLYYPRLPALEFIQRSAPGRVLGLECLPPKLLESHQLRDIRGYDGVDPLAYVQLLSLSYDPQRTSAPEYARTMWYFPEFRESATLGDLFQLHPIRNMLGLRYIDRHESVALPDPVSAGAGYKVYFNNNALPRAWIPEHVERRRSTDDMLKSLRDWDFDPTQRAFTLESTTDIPDGGRGSVELISDNPQFMSLTATMETAGLVVIGDRFDDGWKVSVDGAPAELHCVNHVLRGVAISKGSHAIELRYIPAAFVLGVRLFLAAAVILLAMLVWSCRNLILTLRARE
ncbi:MAG: YfhO family protein, partial [Planctomycetota bacterium]